MSESVGSWNEGEEKCFLDGGDADADAGGNGDGDGVRGDGWVHGWSHGWLIVAGCG